MRIARLPKERRRIRSQQLSIVMRFRCENDSLDFGENLEWADGQTGDQPVVGDWDGDGTSEIGVFRNGLWFMDSDGNLQFDDTDATAFYGQAGDVTVVGDWSGLGSSQIGIERSGFWFLDNDRSFGFDGLDSVVFFGVADDQAVVGTWPTSVQSSARHLRAASSADAVDLVLADFI